MQTNEILVKVISGKRVEISADQLKKLMNYAMSVAGNYQFKTETFNNKIYISKWK